MFTILLLFYAFSDFDFAMFTDSWCVYARYISVCMIVLSESAGGFPPLIEKKYRA